MRKLFVSQTINNIKQYKSCLTILAAFIVFVTLMQVSYKPVNCTCATCHNNLFNAAGRHNNSTIDNVTHRAHRAAERSVIGRNNDDLNHNTNNQQQPHHHHHQQQQQQQQPQQLTDLSQVELNNIRTEFFKYKILDKLGLSDEPRIGARSSEVERDFINNFLKSQYRPLDHVKDEATDNSISRTTATATATTMREADKVILTGHQTGANRLEFDLAQSQLLSMINDKLSSIMLSIRLRKVPITNSSTASVADDTANTATNASANSVAYDDVSNDPSYIRLSLEEYITKAGNSYDTTTTTSKEILIANDRLISSPLINQNNADNDPTKPIKDAAVAVNYTTAATTNTMTTTPATATTTTTMNDADYITRNKQRNSQSLIHEIELLPSIVDTLLKNRVNNKQKSTIGDSIFEKLTLQASNDDENYRHKLVLFLPTDSNIRITSAYLSLFNKVPETMVSRSKRSIDCATIKNNKSSCCRESFYVNFTDIGWDKWILHPPGYYANYCKGHCDLSHARFYHSSILSRFSNLITLCCSPKQMSHLTLIYLDQDHQLHQKVMPDMTVESCDCS